MIALITGVTGFVGRNLLRYIEDNECFEKVYCLCRDATTDIPRSFTVIQGSLETLKNTAPIYADVCIHLAGVINSLNSKPDDFFRVNLAGTKTLVDFCKRSNIPKIVFVSSINVYLEKKYEYALSKLLAEEYIKNSRLDYVILRSSLIYGSGCKSFEQILRFSKLFNVVPVLGNGEAYEQPIYIDEVCRIIIKYTFTLEKNFVVDLYGKTKMTYNEMVKTIANYVGMKPWLLHLPVTPFRMLSEFCFKQKIPFFIQPEQIAHMCEDLHDKTNETYNTINDYQLDDFSKNLSKFL